MPRLLSIFLGILTFTLLILWAIHSFAVFPLLDDLVYPALKNDHGFRGAYWVMNSMVSSRFTANFLLILPGAAPENFTFYRLFSLGCLMLSISGFYLLIKRMGYSRIWAMAALFCVLALLPDPAGSFFFFSAMANYQLGMALSFFLFAFFMKKVKEEKLYFLTPPAFGIAAFILSGFNETLCILLMGVFGIAVLFPENKTSRRLAMFACIGIGLGTVLMFILPGNAARQSYYNEHGSIWMALAFMARYVWQIFLNPIFLILMLLFAFRRRVSLILTLFWLLGLLALAVIPSVLSTGILGQERSISMVLWFMVLGLFWFFRKENVYSDVLRIPGPLLITAMFLLMIFIGNHSAATNDLLDSSVSKYKSEMQYRFDTIIEASKSSPDTVALKPLEHRPTLLFFSDVNEDPEDWDNKSFENAYQIKVISKNSQY